MKLDGLSRKMLFVILFVTAFTRFGFADEVPDWVHNSESTEYLVATSEKFAARVKVIENRLATVRHSLSEWAHRSCGEDCVKIINAIPDADLEALIDKEYIEPIRDLYSNADSSALAGQYDEFYLGHFRISISDELQQKIQKEIANFKLRHRLALTLVTSVFSLGFGAILWCHLVVKRLTRGFYVSRLRWIAGILLVVLAGVCYWISSIVF